MSEATADQAEQPKETALVDVHRAIGARLIDFAGWLMPVQYAGILEEHRAVLGERRGEGVLQPNPQLEQAACGLRGPEVPRLDRPTVLELHALDDQRGQVVPLAQLWDAGDRHDGVPAGTHGRPTMRTPAWPL